MTRVAKFSFFLSTTPSVLCGYSIMEEIFQKAVIYKSTRFLKIFAYSCCFIVSHSTLVKELGRIFE